MALVVADRVQETTTTTGTGTVTLAGASAGYQSFAAIGDGNTTYYTITSGNNWEVGIGTYTLSGTTLARTTVLSSSAGGTTKITLSGTSNVFVTYPSGKALYTDASGNAIALGTPASGTVTNLTGTASININGTVGATTANTGAFTTIVGTTTSATGFAVGRQGTTNPVLNVDASTASVVTGLNLKGAAAAGGMALSVTSSGTNENLTIDAKGSGTITLNGTATGAVSTTRAFSSANQTLTTTSANSLAVGRQGITNPVLNVDASTASVVTGLNVKGAAAAGGMALSVTSSGASENLTIDAKGNGTVTINGTATGAITLNTTTSAPTYNATTIASGFQFGAAGASGRITATGTSGIFNMVNSTGSLFAGLLLGPSGTGYVRLKPTGIGGTLEIRMADDSAYGPFNSAAHLITAVTANSLCVGRQGTINPVLNVDASAVNVNTGLNLKGAASNGGVAVSVTSASTNESVTFDAKGTGTITFNATGTGNVLVNRLLDISASTAGQIKFPATANASADANTLDDYEEGTWTMGVSFGGAAVGITYTLRDASYVKIGRTVSIVGGLTLSNKGSSTGNARVTGLPFTTNTGSNQQYGFNNIAGLVNVTFTGPAALGTYNTGSAATLDIMGSGASATLTDTVFTNTSSVYGSLTFISTT